MNTADPAQVARILREIAVVLGSDHADYAVALEEQAQILTDSADSPDIVQEIYRTTHRAVPGMGGIIDKVPTASTHEEFERLSKMLHRLADELYELTSP